MAHSNAMSPTSPGTWLKLCRRWELKLLLIICLGLPGLIGILPPPAEPTHHLVVIS